MKKTILYLVTLILATNIAFAACIDLDNPGTWAGKVTKDSQTWLIHDDVTLCQN
jgi:hypothetical protein